MLVLDLMYEYINARTLSHHVPSAINLGLISKFGKEEEVRCKRGKHRF